ncbi:MAG: ketoacyl-ACP synthase III [Acidobacteria bacterium]|nr:ketoacyl-ACP synthase III [Acidobacteriota bacterium]
MNNAKIVGTGVYVPERVVTNDEISAILGEDITEFVTQNLGIYERHIAAENESSADLAEKAAVAALNDAGISAADLDLIIVATDTGEYISPSTSVVLQNRIGAINAGTFDTNAACAGFATAMDIASKYIRADENYKNILVVGVYAMSKFLDWHEKKTATIFADGAGAVLLQATTEDTGLRASKLEAYGEYFDSLGILAGGSKMPITHEVIDEGYYNKVRFAKKVPPEVNIDGWQKIVRTVVDRSGLTLDDVSLFLWTQVNLSTIKVVMEAMNIEWERTHTIMGKWGYTGSACIPMVLHDAIQEGKLKRGQNMVICTSGGGVNMAALVFRY